MATNSSRDARRRRIVERGSDRLALITGRIQTLPSSSSSHESYNSHTASCPPSISHHQHLPSHISDQPTSDSPQIEQTENKDFSSLLPKHDSGNESSHHNNYDSGSSLEPFLQKCETGVEASRASGLELDGKVQSSQVSSTVPNSSISTSATEHHFEPQTHHRKIFTPNKINSAIAASESIRIYCSLAAAVLVLLSYVGFPILGSFIIRSIVLTRPLYLVLLTNVSIVLARLLLGKPRGERAEQEANNVPLGGYGLADQVGKTLESGLVLQNIVGAVFMDCSIYAIVVVCGLSLAQKLGW